MNPQYMQQAPPPQQFGGQPGFGGYPGPVQGASQPQFRPQPPQGAPGPPPAQMGNYNRICFSPYN